MTIVRQLLTNGAYGFPKGKPRRVTPVALACCHITGNSRTAAYTDLHAAAQAERNYANRAGSNGPSSTLYIARDGWAVEAIDGTKHAAWSNGDVSRPNTDNPGIRRVLALRAKGYNANEAYWDEFECVGYGSKFPITQAQVDTMGARIAARSKASGLPINRETVHGHWEINGIDRQNCPHPNHEWFLNRVIAAARGTDIADTADTAGDDVMVDYEALPDDHGGTIVVKSGGVTGIPIEGGARPFVKAGTKRPAIGLVAVTDLDDRLCWVMKVGNQLCYIDIERVDFTADDGPNVAQPAPDPLPVKYPVTVGGKSVGEVELP